MSEKKSAFHNISFMAKLKTLNRPWRFHFRSKRSNPLNKQKRGKVSWPDIINIEKIDILGESGIDITTNM